MNRMKLLVVVIAAFAVFGFLGAKDASATWYYNCSVNYIGPSGANVYMWISNNDTGGFQNIMFVANATKAKELLATALTAKVNTQKVWIDVSGITNGSIINGLVLAQ